MNPSRLFRCLTSFLLLTSLTFTASAEERSIASLFPSSSVAFVEIAPASNWIDHPLRTRIRSSKAFKEIWRSDAGMQLRSGLMVAEFALGDNTDSILRKLVAGGAMLVLDKEHQGVSLVIRTEGKEWLDLYLAKLVKLARDEATKNNQADPIKEQDYRTLHAYQFQKAIVAAMDEFLLVSNKDTHAKAIADHFLDKTEGGLADMEEYKQAARVQETSSNQDRTKIAWGSLNVQTLRDAGIAKDLLGGKAKDFGAELILGGLLASLNKTPMVAGELTVGNSDLVLALHSPHDPKWAGEERNFFFGSNGDGHALPLINIEGMIGSLSAYRDVSQLWLRAGDLFDVAVNDQLAQADSTLTTLFSGRDFGEDILGAVYPEMRVVVSRQEFQESDLKPTIQLPSFAVVAKLKDPKTLKKELKRIFQSLIGLLNITGAMNGQPQLDLDIEMEDDQQYVVARFVKDFDLKEGKEVPIQFNFSPSLAFVNDYAILSSTVPLSKQLVTHLKSGNLESGKPELGLQNTIAQVSSKALSEALQVNRKQLISQNMLENGHSKQEAESEVDMMFKLIQLFESATLGLGFSDQAKIDVSLYFAE